MPRWKALPEELDPQIREFTSQLRRLVDRSGLTINAVADSTGYSKTSWERYLNGRLLAPRGAVVALAEVTDAPQHHLMTMWELAERAWSRAEMRHDMTMETIRISQARAALDHHGTTAPGAPTGGRSGRTGRSSAVGHGGDAAHRPDGRGADAYGFPAPDAHDPARPPSVPQQRGGERGARRARPEASSRRGRKATGGARRKGPMLVVGAVGALIVVVGAVLLAPGGDDAAKATPPPSKTPSAAAPERPVGVECSGADCAGQDPEKMGCGGEFARTVATAVVGGGKIEVRYSKVCSAAWARLTEAAIGDTVQITAGKGAQDGEVMGDTDAYTPMIAVKKPSDAKACATLTSGTEGCTDPGR
ncbi:DUF2690 domain-containing protein [Streptomyces sp. NPDC087897]|uniref:DUF2690 domain-containing protein n=1 Tax=Streptomyces sp. NPDC087897 TaxID=3365817 RepID=UPI003817207C